MSRMTFARYLNPWKFRREQDARRTAALRERDGDHCARCRRPMRFDLPAGHDLGPKVEQLLPGAAGGPESIDNLCLCHGRCNASSGDSTSEVVQRVRQKSEAALFAAARSRRSA